MTSKEIREKFLEFFESRGHKIVPSSSLVPKDDPSVLLTTAGMQQFKPYFTGEKDPLKDFGSRRVASIQKSFRTSDIDEVGDESHLTFFEMLGHFSFGDYFKKETIEWTFELLTKIFGIAPERMSVSVFGGDQKIPKDQESYDAWLKFLPSERIKLGLREDGNVWGPAGPEGPCGACNEVYVDDLEVATLVFMEYFYSKDGIFKPLKQKGVDVGWGLERLAMVVQNVPTIFDTDLFEPLILALPTADTDKKRKRIISDHARASFFLISDSITPSNKEQGYVLRRLIRRMIVHAHLETFGSFLGIDTLSMGISEDIKRVFNKIYQNYSNFYPELNLSLVNEVFDKEFNQFNKTFRQGLKEIKLENNITAPSAFNLYGTFGITFEIIKDVGGDKAKNLKIEDFEKEVEKHQAISRAGAEKKFGGHGLEIQNLKLKDQNLENIEKITRLHTATHLLHQALHDVLGGEAEIKQMGSDITEERTRFDFSFHRKLTTEEISRIENIVNEKIKMDLPVYAQKMSKEIALKLGARAFFKEKYPDEVNVYSFGDPDLNKAYSKEFCGGPHVKSTGEIGIFKIIKEESSSAGVRRIRAIVR